MATSGTRRRILVGLPNARIIRDTEPSDIVREGIDERTSLGGIPFRDEAIQNSVVSEPLIVRVRRVDVELVRKELIVVRFRYVFDGTRR